MPADTITEPVVESALSDEEVRSLNEARDVLAAFGKRCGDRSWSVPSGYVGASEPNCADYGRLHALADVAAGSIFDVLNWANSHHVAPLTEEQLHNRPEATVEHV